MMMNLTGHPLSRNQLIKGFTEIPSFQGEGWKKEIDHWILHSSESRSLRSRKALGLIKDMKGRMWALEALEGFLLDRTPFQLFFRKVLEKEGYKVEMKGERPESLASLIDAHEQEVRNLDSHFLGKARSLDMDADAKIRNFLRAESRRDIEEFILDAESLVQDLRSNRESKSLANLAHRKSRDLLERDYLGRMQEWTT